MRTPELEGDKKTDGARGPVRGAQQKQRQRWRQGGGACGAGLIPVLCAGESPLIMQMAPGVTLLCAPWAVAERERRGGQGAPLQGPYRHSHDLTPPLPSPQL